MSRQMRALEHVKASIAEAELDRWPIDESQVVAGDPQASGCILWRSDDGRRATGIWECTPGRFKWIHVDEMACVVQGRATITPAGEEPFEVGPGDVFFLAAGLHTQWDVSETVRKGFHLHSVEPLEL